MSTPQVAASPTRVAAFREILGDPRRLLTDRKLRPYAIGGAAGILLVIVTVWFFWAIPLGRAMDSVNTPTIVLVSADGHPFARRGAFREDPVDVSTLPPHVGQAFVAIEDRRFFTHHGFDLRSIARALRANFQRGRVREGGSTITQQLAKNAFLTNDRTLRRKVQELVIALYLEARLTKQQILSRYLSSVYFGDGVYGLRAAALHYFSKPPEQLTVGEAALLAGIVRSPTRLAPTDHLAAARRRQAQVLHAMVETHVLTEVQARRARRVRLHVRAVQTPLGSYFADWVLRNPRLPLDRDFGDVPVATTLDSRLQAEAERILRRTLAGPGHAMGATQGAIVAMRTDGSVLAMVGGRDYRASSFNRAADAGRQPGSSFKLFVYMAALRAGATPDTTVSDTPLRIGDWTPANYEQHYSGGPITLRDAFARSSNVAAVRVCEDVGRHYVIQSARDLGLVGELPDNPTVALGSGQVNLLEMTAAYASVAAGQYPVRPYGVTGRPEPGQVRRYEPRIRDELLDMLHAVVTRGTGRAANLPQGAYGKTGTSQDYRDAWFFGFVGDVVIGVWVGNDDNSPMHRVAGGTLPAQIWRDVMTYAVAHVGVRQEGVLAAAARAPAVPTLTAEPKEPVIEADPALEELPPSDQPYGEVRPPSVMYPRPSDDDANEPAPGDDNAYDRGGPDDEAVIEPDG